MSLESITLEQLKALKPEARRAIDRFFINSYDEFVAQVSLVVEKLLFEWQQQPQIYRDLSEDVLTTMLITHLRTLEFNAHKDAETGGHVDIRVDYPGQDFLWLAEAKLDHNQEHVHEGYLQLTTRYATGLPNQSCGAVIIYNAKNAVTPFLTEVKKNLCKKVDKNIEFISYPKFPNQSFYINVPLVRLGSNSSLYNIRYFSVSLYFKPQDKSGRTAKKYQTTSS